MVPGGRAILMNEAGEVLFHKRTDFENLWSLPGGAAEVGESIEEAVIREVKEETGLEVLEHSCIGFSSNPMYERYTYPNGDEVQVFAIIIWCKVWTGTLTPSNDESPQLQFFPLGDLPPLAKNEIQTLVHFKEYRKENKFIVY